MSASQRGGGGGSSTVEAPRRFSPVFRVVRGVVVAVVDVHKEIVLVSLVYEAMRVLGVLGEDVLLNIRHLAGSDRARPSEVEAMEGRYGLCNYVRRDVFSRAYFLFPIQNFKIYSIMVSRLPNDLSGEK